MTAPEAPEVVLVAALDRASVIGRGLTLPWRLPDDLRRFKSLTLGHPIVMGRRTFESIGRPLPGRTNLVLSRALADDALPGVRVVRSVEAALAAAAADRSGPGRRGVLFVIGGADVYAAFLPLADRLELTHVEAEVDGDVRFPPWDPAAFTVASESHRAPDEAHAHPLRFATYVRRH